MEGITDEQLEKAAESFYPTSPQSNQIHRLNMDADRKIWIAGAKYILSHSVDREPNVIDSLKENEYLDFTELDESVITEFIKEVASACSKDLLKTFLGCGLKTHIEQMIINDKTGEEYILSFQTSEVFKKRFNVDSVQEGKELSADRDSWWHNESARQYAESKMPAFWDRKDPELTGLFYKYFIEFLQASQFKGQPIEEADKIQKAIDELDKIHKQGKEYSNGAFGYDRGSDYEESAFKSGLDYFKDNIEQYLQSIK